jgi:hypothetical protein
MLTGAPAAGSFQLGRALAHEHAYADFGDIGAAARDDFGFLLQH